MNGLPEDVKLDFLIDRRLLSIEPTSFLLRLAFDDGVAINAESGVFIDGLSVTALNAHETLAELLRKRVAKVERRGRGDLILRFENDAELAIQDANDHYESYSISSSDGVIVV